MSRDTAEQFLRRFTWLTVTDTDAQWAFAQYDGKDFEDTLQIACAKRESCKVFATLDKTLAKRPVDGITIALIA